MFSHRFWEVPSVLGWTFCWCRQTTRLLWSCRVCGLRFANEEVAQLEAGHGLYLGPGRGWEMVWFRCTTKPRGGQNVRCRCCELFVVLAGHVVTNNTKGDLLYRGHPTPQQMFFIFCGKDKPSKASSECFFSGASMWKYFPNARTSY